MPGTARAVFLSYRREETRHIAGRLADRLTERLGSTQVFIDVDMIEPGSDFAATIVREIASCDVLITLIGPAWSTIADPQGRRRLDDPDDLVVLEIQTALERGIRVIPVLVDGAVMPDRHDLPQGLQDLALRNAVRLDYETFRTDIVTLLDAVERALPALPQQTAAPPEGTDNRIVDPAHANDSGDRRPWIATLTRDGRWRWTLLASVIATVLPVSGLLLIMLINPGTPAQPTSIELVASPGSAVSQGSRVTLTAAITPAAVAGTVQFKDGVTDLSSPVPVSNGTASGDISLWPIGSHQLTAVFMPTDPAAFASSTSPALRYLIIPPVSPRPPPEAGIPTATVTELISYPDSRAAEGSIVVLTARLTPLAAAGTVQFKDGATNLGSPVPVSSNGTASGTTSTLAPGPHKLIAVFIPDDPAAFSLSTSPTLSFMITAGR